MESSEEIAARFIGIMLKGFLSTTLALVDIVNRNWQTYKCGSLKSLAVVLFGHLKSVGTRRHIHHVYENNTEVICPSPVNWQ